MAETINLGDSVKDNITGATGIAVAVTDWLYQCRRVGVQSKKLDKDGRAQEPFWVDEPQLSVVKCGAVLAQKPVKATLARTGGPSRESFRSRDPQR